MNVELSTKLTAEQFEALPDTQGYELLDGYPVEKTMGLESSIVQSTIHTLLGAYIIQNKLGLLMDSECGYQIFPDRPNRVRKPDISFIRRERLPDGKLPRGNCKIIPDLAIEGVSLHELADDTNAKLMDFLGVGVPLVWLVFPASETVQVFRKDGTASWLTNEGELSGEDILPDFRLPVKQIFEQLHQGENQ